MTWWQIAALALGIVVMLVCAGVAVLLMIAAGAVDEYQEDE